MPCPQGASYPIIKLPIMYPVGYHERYKKYLEDSGKKFPSILSISNELYRKSTGVRTRKQKLHVSGRKQAVSLVWLKCIQVKSSDSQLGLNTTLRNLCLQCQND